MIGDPGLSSRDFICTIYSYKDCAPKINDIFSEILHLTNMLNLQTFHTIVKKFSTKEGSRSRKNHPPEKSADQDNRDWMLDTNNLKSSFTDRTVLVSILDICSILNQKTIFLFLVLHFSMKSHFFFFLFLIFLYFHLQDIPLIFLVFFLFLSHFFEFLNILSFSLI